MSFTKENILTSSVLAFYCFCVMVQGFWLDEKMPPIRHLDDESNMTLAFMTWIDESERYLLCQEFVEQALIRGSVMPSHQISKEQVQIMMQECNSLRRKRRQIEGETYSNYAALPDAAFNYDLVFPGTKWCGAGDTAENDDDLGYEADTDRCCRTHDMCDDTILAGETGHGLKNDGKYTALNCRCDNGLNDCLSKVDTVTSNIIGNLYFNILKSRCFKEDYPQTNKCKTYAGLLHLRCVEYEQDTTKPKIYQWFPAQVYKKFLIFDKTTGSISFSEE